MSESTIVDGVEFADGQVDRLDELMSLFLDDSLSEEQAAELNERLLQDPAARSRTIDMTMLHADLYSFFNQPSQKPAIPPLSISSPAFDTQPMT